MQTRKTFGTPGLKPAEEARFRSASWGPRILGAAALWLGIIGVVRADFTAIWHPVPDALPARLVFVFTTAGIFIVAGLSLLVRGAGVRAPRTLAVLLALLSTGWLLRVVAYPQLVGTWVGFAEQMALALGAAAVAAGTPLRRSWLTCCRIGFGMCEVVFSLGHFMGLVETVAMTPAWLPFGRTFWALATGAIHLLGGVALIAGFKPTAATRVLAAMFAAFGLLVWLPKLLANSSDPVAWSGNAINLALIGAVLSVGVGAKQVPAKLPDRQA